ncbi:MAG TPA: hypothetical protein VJT31_40380, partial [Rugosimonospora sp.]|nr:hypothetical protein [Rugosimonospora sp.]
MRGRFILRVLLAVGCLVPTGVLFVQFWQSTSDKVAFVARERDGVTYLGALAQLSTALAQADAAASGGDAAPAGALGRAVDTVSAVDLRLGDELRTHERWTDLRGKIGSLPHSGTDPAAADTAYHGVGELLLALYTKVQTA